MRLKQCTHVLILHSRARGTNQQADVSGALQQTLYSLNGFRIDQQLNGPVQRGDNGDFYWQVAVQAGSNLYAAVMIPAGDNVSAGGIRKALYQSLQDGALYGFARSAKKTWRWTIVLGALLILVL